MVTRFALIVVAFAGGGAFAGSAACQGNGSAPRDAAVALEPSKVAPIDAVIADNTDAKPDEPEPDSNKLIAELGAIPAWQTVIDRAQLLARRDQHGVAYGRIGPVVMVPAPVVVVPATGSGSAAKPAAPAKPELVASPYVWLIDDTEGNGALGMRIALGTKSAKNNDRVAVGGAWQLDDARRWYWKVDSLQALPAVSPDPKSPPPPPEPGHVVAGGNLIPGSHTITVAKENEAVYFTVVGAPPANDGDGWPIANELGDPVYALLILPGERASYGSQDMRGADERWVLKRGQTYTLRIGRIRTRGDKPAVIYAKSAPIRVL